MTYISPSAFHPFFFVPTKKNGWSPKRKRPPSRPDLKYRAGHYPPRNSLRCATLKQALRLTPPALYFSLRAPASSNGRGAEWDFEVNTQARGLRCDDFLYRQARPSQALGQARTANIRSLAQPAYYSRGGKCASGHAFRCYENQAMPAPDSAARVCQRSRLPGDAPAYSPFLNPSFAAKPK